MMIQEALELALQHFQAARLPEAEDLCRQVLARQPENADALHLLGLIAHQTGHGEIAISLIQRATLLEPNCPEFFSNLGLVLAGAGNIPRAIAAYRSALAIRPDYPQACSNLANALQSTGDFQQAIEMYSRALAAQPDFPDARNNLGNVLRTVGRLEEAIPHYRMALAQNPRFVQCHNNLAVSLLETHRLDDAEKHCRTAIALRPDYAECHANLGNVLTAQKQFEDAIVCYRQAIALQPMLPEPYTNMGNAMMQLGRIDEAIDAFNRSSAANPRLAAPYCNLSNAQEAKGNFEEAIRQAEKAIAAQADCPEAYNNLGNALGQLLRFDEARAAYDKAIAIRPTYAEAFNNTGTLLVRCGKARQAIDSFHQALALRPDNPETEVNLAMTLLLTGDFENGWRQYESRRKNPAVDRPTITAPMWDGSDLSGKRILLHCEQGLGDAIHFARYIPMVLARGGGIILEAPSLVLPLLRQIPGIDEFIVRNDPLPGHAVHCSLVSLPLIFNTTLETIPRKIPYLSADPEKTERWRKILSGHSNLRVGLVWAGRPDYKNDRNRSMQLATLAPLAGVKGVTFFNLQKGAAAEQIRDFSGRTEIIDYAVDLHDFSDTAAMVSNLDLIISVDTAVAHLAGAMGKDVWTMLPFAPDWRWLLDREDSPWYPTMRLFRQQRQSDWTDPLERAVKSLQDKAAGKRRG